MSEQHIHSWHPISYEVDDAGEIGEAALWACSGSTSKGRCIATATRTDRDKERRSQGRREARELAEREQRHTQL